MYLPLSSPRQLRNSLHVGGAPLPETRRAQAAPSLLACWECSVVPHVYSPLLFLSSSISAPLSPPSTFSVSCSIPSSISLGMNASCPSGAPSRAKGCPHLPAFPPPHPCLSRKSPWLVLHSWSSWLIQCGWSKESNLYLYDLNIEIASCHVFMVMGFSGFIKHSPKL